MERASTRWSALFFVALILLGWAQPAHGAPEDVIEVPDPVLRGCINGSYRYGQEQDVTRERITGLTELDCDTRDALSDLSGLEHATNLVSLELRASELQDLSVVAELENLESLALTEASGEALQKLPALHQLDELVISRSSIPIGALPDLPNLNHLGIRSHEAELDLSQLERFSTITSLEVFRSDVTDLTQLPDLPNLESLKIVRNNIADALPLARFSSLKTLDLTENPELELTSIPPLSNLESLSMGRNDLSDLDELAEFEKLTFLALDGNEFTQFPDLDGLPELEIVDLNQNRIADLSPAVNYPHLEQIVAYDQYIILPTIDAGTVEENPVRHLDGSAVELRHHRQNPSAKSSDEVCADDECTELYFPETSGEYTWKFGGEEVVDGLVVGFAGIVSRQVQGEEPLSVPLEEVLAEERAAEQREQTRRYWLFAGAGAALVVLIAGGFLFARRGRDGG